MFENPIGSALIPGMSPPASQTEFETRKQGWAQTLSDPAFLAGMFQFGTALMSPGPVGQTSSGHVANAMNRGFGAMNSVQQQNRDFGLKQQEVEGKNQMREAQIRQANAYTKKAEADVEDLPAKRKHETATRELEIAKLESQIASYEKAGLKYESEALKRELELKYLPEKQKADLDYKNALTAEAQARTKAIGSGRGSGSKSANIIDTKVTKISDGRVLVTRTNKETGEVENEYQSWASPAEVDDAIFNENMLRKEAGQKPMTAAEERAMRAELSRPKVQKLPLGNNSFGQGMPQGSAGVPTPGQAELMRNNPNLQMPGSGTSSPSPTPSAPSAQKKEFTFKWDGKQFVDPSGQPFQQPEVRDLLSDLKRREEEIRQYSRMAANADGEDKKRLVKKVTALRKEYQALKKQRRNKPE